jgi:N4-gp56 family major capsid protein
MAVDGFRPEIWASEILSNLNNELVYGALCNRNYEGEIQNAGDTVHITSIGSVSTRAYTELTSITWDEVADTQQDLLIDQKRYFALKVDDVERKQALPFLDEATREAAYALRDNADAVVSAAMYAAVNATGNDIGAKTADISDNTAYGILVSLATTLDRDNCPSDNRWVVVSPELHGALQQDARFTDASASGSTDPLRNGFIGRAAGFNLYKSNQTPDPTASTYAVIAGHPSATCYAEQILETEAIRLQDFFGDGVRGLHVFGVKVVRPTCLALASVTVQA